MTNYKMNEYIRQGSQHIVWNIANKYIDLIMNVRGGLHDIGHMNDVFLTNKNQFYAELRSHGYKKDINVNLPEIFIWNTCEKTLNRLHQLQKDNFSCLYHLEYLIKKRIVEF